MLKFHINDTTVLTTFEDFILTVYVNTRAVQADLFGSKSKCYSAL